jgi:hypothetical protein
MENHCHRCHRYRAQWQTYPLTFWFRRRSPGRNVIGVSLRQWRI